MDLGRSRRAEGLVRGPKSPDYGTGDGGRLAVAVGELPGTLSESACGPLKDVYSHHCQHLASTAATRNRPNLNRFPIEFARRGGQYRTRWRKRQGVLLSRNQSRKPIVLPVRD